MEKESTSSLINPLVVIFQPREIKQCLEAASTLPCDRLYMRFIPQEEAYFRSREFFLDHKEYTHFVILPDDLVATREAFDYLKQDAEKFDIVAGWCNNTSGGSKYDYLDTDISINHVSLKEPHTNTYEDMIFASIYTLERTYPHILQARFSGFALQFIARQIIAYIPFRADFGCCVDTCFAIDLLARNIPQYVDTRCRMLHIRTKPDILQVGKREGSMELVKYL